MLNDPVQAKFKGRHNKAFAQHTNARYHLRGGMAKVALKAKVDGKPAEDSVGRPLLYANELAERTGIRQLQQWANGSKAVIGLFSGMEFKCRRCRRVTRNCSCA